MLCEQIILVHIFYIYLCSHFPLYFVMWLVLLIFNFLPTLHLLFVTSLKIFFVQMVFNCSDFSSWISFYLSCLMFFEFLESINWFFFSSVLENSQLLSFKIWVLFSHSFPSLNPVESILDFLCIFYVSLFCFKDTIKCHPEVLDLIKGFTYRALICPKLKIRVFFYLCWYVDAFHSW